MTGYGASPRSWGCRTLAWRPTPTWWAAPSDRRRIATPLIADGDTGYGGLLNVQYTVRGYEAAGAIAIQLEDQEFPKKCGHMLGRRVVPIEDMVDKIKVATSSRDDSNFLIIARTDARTTLGPRRSFAPRRGLCQSRRGHSVRRKSREPRRDAHDRPHFRQAAGGQYGRGRAHAGRRSKDPWKSSDIRWPSSRPSDSLRRAKRCARSTRTSSSTARASAATCRSTSSCVQRTHGLRRGLEFDKTYGRK